MGRHEKPGPEAPDQPFRPAFELHAVDQPQPAVAEPVEVQPQLEDEPMMRNRQLGLDEVVELDWNAGLADSRLMENWMGLNARLMAVIEAGGKKFFVTDVSQDPGFEADVVVLDESFPASQGTNHGFKSIWPDQSVDFGRDFL